MNNVPYFSPPMAVVRGRGGSRGRPAALVSHQPTMSGGMGRGYLAPPSPQHQNELTISSGSGGRGPSPMSPPIRQQSGGGTSAYPNFGSGPEVVKQLQLKISSLEHRLLCALADQEKLHLTLDRRTKELEGLKVKHSKLEEEYDSIASYAVIKAGGNLKDGKDEDQHFAQKCAKLEAKIARNKALTADNKRIQELEALNKKLEGENKKLEGEKKTLAEDNKKLAESLQSGKTDMEIQKSLISRYYGMFRMFAEAAKENFKDINSFVEASGGGLDESMVLEDAPMLEENGGKLEITHLNFHQGSRSIKSLTPSPISSSSCMGAGLQNGGGCSRSFNDFDEEEDELPPPAAFLDAISGLTPEDLEALDQLEMEFNQKLNK